MGKSAAAGGHRARSSRLLGMTAWRQYRSSAQPRWWWLVIPLCGGLGLTAGVLWAILMPRTYTATAYAFVAVNPAGSHDFEGQGVFSDSKFALQRTPTYAALATSTKVLQGVVADLHHGDIDQLRRQVEVIAIPDRVILQLSATDTDPQVAIQIADSVMANLGRVVGSIELGAGTNPVDLGNAQHLSAPVQILPIQHGALGPPTPRRYKALAGLFVGLVVGFAAVYLVRFRRGARGRRSESWRPGSSARAARAGDVDGPTVGATALR
jgi:capsular polysaccharide biosynthesis protein